MDRIVRKALLKPLARRRTNPASRNALSEALDRLDKRAFASAYVPELAQMQRAAQANRTPGSWKDPEAARLSIVFAQALFTARRKSGQEYTFLVAIAAEGVHEGRIADGTYPELKEIQQSIEAVRQCHGLAHDEYWPVGEGPHEYQELNARFEAACENRFIETLHEFEVHDIATLVQNNRGEFDRRRERGRRAFFHKGEVAPVITDIVVRYEADARRAASVGAYSAAITLLGAAMEGLLLLRCLRSKRKAQEVAAALPKKKRPRATNDPTAWTFDTLIDTCMSAGWLPVVSTQLTTIRPDALAHILRRMRNHVHPGRVANERPWIEADEHEYNDAEAIYATLFATVSGSHSRKKLSEAAQVPLLSAADIAALGQQP